MNKQWKKQRARDKMALHKYNGWIITSEGGFITIKRFEATKLDEYDHNILYHWAFRLKDCKALCDKRDAGEEIGQLYLKPLY